MKRIWAAITLFLVSSAAFACGGSDNDAQPGGEPGFPLTIEGASGAVILEGPAERIASLSAHATEILCAIGAADRMIAVEKFANCPLGSGDKPELDSFQPNIEAIVGVEPDLVIVVFDPSGLVEALQRLDVPVVDLALPTTLDGVLDQVRLFGNLSDRSEAAAELVQSMEASFENVRGRLAGIEQGPRIFHELTDDYFTATPESFIGDFYRLLKAENIAAGAPGEYPQLNAEVIVERNPEVIILADEAAGVDAAAVRARPGWDVIVAVQNDRICSVDPDIVSRPGPRVVEALDALAECLYPDIFP